MWMRRGARGGELALHMFLEFVAACHCGEFAHGIRSRQVTLNAWVAFRGMGCKICNNNLVEPLQPTPLKADISGPRRFRGVRVACNFIMELELIV